MSQTEQRPAEAGQLAQALACATPIKRRRNHRLTRADAEQICDLIVLRANEREACAALGIPYSSWNHFKTRPANAEMLEDIKNRIRGAKLKAHLDNVERFSKKDWRASIAYLEKVLPEKYSSKIEVTASPVPPATVNLTILNQTFERLLPVPQPKELTAKPPAQLPPANPDETPKTETAQ